MQDVKFRVFEKYQQQTYDAFEIDFTHQKVLCLYKGVFKNWLHLRDVVLLPYTGMKDLDGLDVFEGDILKHDDDELTVYYDPSRAAFRCRSVVTPNLEVDLFPLIADGCRVSKTALLHRIK